MHQKLRVLIVEDSEDDALLLVRSLRQAGYEPNVARVDTRAAMQDALERQQWDLVIADYALPQFSAPAALQLLRERGLDLPCIVVSGAAGEEIAVAMMKAGAHDYIVKSNLSRLVPAIERELREAALRREHRQAALALRESEARFRRLAQNAPDLIFRYQITPNRGFEYVSPAAITLTGYTPEDFYTDPDIARRLVGADEYAQLRRVLIEGSGIDQPLVMRWFRQDGTPIWIEQRSTPIYNDAGLLIAIEGIVRDITAHKQAEAQIRREMARAEALANLAARRLDHLQALRTIDMAITASLDLRVTLNVLLDQTTAQLGVDAAIVLLFDAYTQTLEYAAGRGLPAATLAVRPMRLNEGYAGQAVLSRQPVVIPDLTAAPDTVEHAVLAVKGMTAYYAVPLIAKGQVKGVLEIFHRTPLTPDGEWEDFLGAVAGQAAIAIDSAELFSNLQRSRDELALAYDATLEGWSRALDLRDHETEGHTQRVTAMTLALARAMGVMGEELVRIRRGALLHDIGKMGIPDEILLKPGPLTAQEWEIMRQHPIYAYELLEPITFLRPTLDIPYCHHEKWDGSGYPRGLSDHQIPLPARIFAVVDVWDALSSDRPYRKGWPEDQVRTYIRANAGIHFDPTVVRVFLEEVAHRYPRPGSRRTFRRRRPFPFVREQGS